MPRRNDKVSTWGDLSTIHFWHREKLRILLKLLGIFFDF